MNLLYSNCKECPHYNKDCPLEGCTDGEKHSYCLFLPCQPAFKEVPETNKPTKDINKILSETNEILKRTSVELARLSITMAKDAYYDLLNNYKSYPKN